MKRQRYIAGDPARSTAETFGAIVDLIAASLPKAEDVRPELSRAATFIKYLVASEATAGTPLVLRAGDALDCEIFTTHGMDALTAEAAAAPPGGARETDWTLLVPVPAGAPFTAEDVHGASKRLVTDDRGASKRATRKSEGAVPFAVDPDELKKAVQ